jgi:hypothetical protein
MRRISLSLDRIFALKKTSLFAPATPVRRQLGRPEPMLPDKRYLSAGCSTGRAGGKVERSSSKADPFTRAEKENHPCNAAANNTYQGTIFS